MTIKIKIILSSLFVLLAVTSVIFTKSFYSFFVLPAVCLCWIGDMTILQARVFKGRVKEPLKIGMIFFALAHVSYIIAFGGKVFDSQLSARAFAVILFAYLILFFLSLFFKRLDIAIYTFILSMSGAFSAAAGLGSGSIWILVAIGVLLFILSDALIAIHEFGKKRIPCYDFFVWLTYSLAQVLIITTAIFA